MLNVRTRTAFVAIVFALITRHGVWAENSTPPSPAGAGQQSAPRSRVDRVRIPTYLAQEITRTVVLPREIGIRGNVEIDVLVEKDGTVIKVQGLSGDARLLRTTKKAVMKWTFIPYLLFGKPVQFIAKLKFRFDGKNRLAKLEISEEEDPLFKR